MVFPPHHSDMYSCPKSFLSIQENIMHLSTCILISSFYYTHISVMWLEQVYELELRDRYLTHLLPNKLLTKREYFSIPQGGWKARKAKVLYGKGLMRPIVPSVQGKRDSRYAIFCICVCVCVRLSVGIHSRAVRHKAPVLIKEDLLYILL